MDGLVKQFKKDSNGQAMAEFALIFPIILILCLSIMQLALIANAQTVFHYAIYAATRSGVVQRNPTDENNLRNVAGILCLPLDPASLLKVEIKRAEQSNRILEVEGLYHYRLIIPGASGVLKLLSPSVWTDPWSIVGAPHIPLHSSCAMMVESPGP